MVGALLSAKTDSSKYLLVCAPSNAAIDEIVVRLSKGVMGLQGTKFNPGVVRIGAPDMMSQYVKENFWLDALVEKKYGEKSLESTEEDLASDQIEKMEAELSQLKQEISLVEGLQG